MSLGAESHASIPLPLGYQLLLKGCSNVLWPLQHIPESEKKKMYMLAEDSRAF